MSHAVELSHSLTSPILFRHRPDWLQNTWTRIVMCYLFIQFNDSIDIAGRYCRITGLCWWCGRPCFTVSNWYRRHRDRWVWMFALKVVYHIVLTRHGDQCIAFFAEQIDFCMHFAIVLHGCVSTFEILVAIDFWACSGAWETPGHRFVLCIFANDDEVIVTFVIARIVCLILLWCFHYLEVYATTFGR